MTERTSTPRWIADRRPALPRWGLLLMAALLATIGLPDDSFGESDPPADGETLSVGFDDLGLAKKRGDLTVRYAITEESWERLADRDITLWMHVSLPTPEKLPQQTVSYTLGVDERRGTLSYPDWLSVPRGEAVGLCLLGTGPGDQLGFGRGWICRDTLWFEVSAAGRDGSPRSQTIDLDYHDGPPYLPYAPWTEPPIPDFPGPFDQLPSP